MHDLLDASKPRFVASAPACSPAPCHESSAECAYNVAWSINAHMRVGSVTPRRAVRQHSAFVELLRHLGADVTCVPFVHGAYDSVFMKDSAVLIQRADGAHALLSRPKHDVRRMEQPERFRSLVAAGFLVHVTHGFPLEGGDVVMLPDASGAFMGYGFRTSRFSALDLEHFLRAPVIPVQLRDPRFYHLDMALNVLNDGTTLICEEAFTRESLAVIRKRCEAHCIRVSVGDALRFAVNVVQIGRDLVCADSSPLLEQQLRASGYRVHVSPLDEFHAAGGSAACLVARMYTDAKLGRAATTSTRSVAA